LHQSCLCKNKKQNNNQAWHPSVTLKSKNRTCGVLEKIGLVASGWTPDANLPEKPTIILCSRRCIVVALALAHSGSLAWWLCVVRGFKSYMLQSNFPLWLKQMLLLHDEVIPDDNIIRKTGRGSTWQYPRKCCSGATCGCLYLAATSKTARNFQGRKQQSTILLLELPSNQFI